MEQEAETGPMKQEVVERLNSDSSVPYGQCLDTQREGECIVKTMTNTTKDRLADSDVAITLRQLNNHVTAAQRCLIEIGGFTPSLFGVENLPGLDRLSLELRIEADKIKVTLAILKDCTSKGDNKCQDHTVSL